ncbi:MAG: capsule assembly Wzi family protein, partial [Cyclobacteriaceae bacterium]
SLIMSNNARGFSHLTLNTQKPAITPIGSFEGQLIVGRLQSKEYNELPLPERHNKNPWVFTKKDEWRYLNGITFSYQPKWIPGLFLGGSRVIQNYFDSTKIQKSYLPIFDNFFREKDQNQHDDGSKDQIASIFARWVIFPATSEIYFEYGKSDASWNLRDFLMSPEHSRAYMVGFTKLINFKSTNQQIEISLETTHLEKSKTGTLRAEPSWYRNAELRQGYTHKGEILGAGIGPGSNSQNLSVSWINCFKKVGVLYERVVNNNDFYSRAFDLTDPTGSWVNSSFGILFSWNWDHLLLDSKLQFVHSDNYQWVRDSDRNNLYLSIRSIYLF